MSGPAERAFAGNTAFDDARAYIAQRAEGLQETRRAGSIAAGEGAIAAALADGRVQTMGALDRRVYVTFNEHGEFQGLRVTTKTKEPVFEHQR